MLSYRYRTFLHIFFPLLLMIALRIHTAESDDSPLPTPLCHSAFLAKPLSQNVVLELGMTNYFRYHCNYNFYTRSAQRKTCEATLEGITDSWHFSQEHEYCGCLGFILDIQPFFFVSTNTKQITEYLLPNGDPNLTVEENNSSDISSPWIQITTPDQSFSSLLCFSPQRIECGITFNFFTRVGALCRYEHDILQRIWLSAFIPIEWVNQKLHIKEHIKSTTPASPFDSAIAAFNNPAWNFGKLSPNGVNKFGVADIFLRLGYDFLLNDMEHLAIYGCLLAPTSHGTNAKHLFEPTIGNLGHWGLGFGLNGDWMLVQTQHATNINWITDIRFIHSLARHERRSFDLSLNEAWSRYLLVATLTNLENPLPGINYFTQRIKIQPRHMVNVWTAAHFAHRCGEGEIGYNFWWRQSELANDFQDPNVVIYDIQGIPGSRTSASTATIQTGAPGTGAPISDIVPQLVNASDIAVSSCTVPDIFISTFYASYGKTVMYHDRPALMSLGIYYDWSHRTSGFSGVGFWFKASLVF